MGKRSTVRRTTPVDQSEKAYRALVQSTRPTLPSRSASLEDIYSHFGLSHDGALAQQHVIKHLDAQIASAFRAPPTGSRKGVRLQTLKRQLLLRHFADSEPLQPYLALLQVIMDAARANDWIAPPLTDELSWRTALTAAANHDLLLGTHRDPDAMLPQFNQRQYAVACAIKRLRTLGYKVAIVGGQANIQRAEEVRIAEHIESQIRSAGGLEMAAYIFHSLRQRYDSAQERYHVGRRTGTDGRKGGPSAPVAYLLNLCAKNTGVSAAKTPFAEAAAKDAFSVATAYASAFDLEPYNTWETLFHSGSRLPHFLQEIAVYDGMFNLVQARPSAVEKILRGLFNWFDDAAASRDLGWTIGQAALVARAILKISRDVHGPSVFTHSHLAAWMPGLPPPALAAILRVFSHKVGAVNRGYRLPHEQTKVDSWFKPLIEQAPGRYVLMDRSWCAPAFYEAVFGAIRERIPNTDRKKLKMLDQKIGDSLEEFVRAELGAHGVRVVSGEYSIDGEHGECDAVVETTDRIIFIEMKKKSLTRSSRSGNNADLFYDLSESLLAAQYQIGKHELLLYRHGVLHLRDGGEEYRLERKSRAVERVALSLLDFGAMQDRMVLSQVLDTVMTSRVGTPIPAYAAKIGRVQKNGEALHKQYNELAKLRPEPKAPAFMNCWFLSLNQLLVILDGVSSNDSFQKSLFTTRHIVMGSLDFYFEHAQALALKSTPGL